VSNGENPSEDRTILAAVEALEGSASPAGATGAQQTAETETLARLYNEVLGLIPFELDPLAPSPESRARLMSLVQGDPPRPAAETAPAPASPRGSREMPTPRPVPPGRPALSMSRRPSRWPLAIAAILALVAFGAFGLSGWLYQQLSQEQATVASLRRDVESERARVAAALAEAQDLRTASGKDLSDLRTLREKLRLTSRAAVVAAMRPMGKRPLQPAAHGILFVAANHQHWYMTVDGLQPAEPGQIYKLWFVAGKVPVDAGSFQVRAGQPIELTSKQMPADTKGALITLERDPNVPKPTGPEILRAAAMYQVG
jgi:anti-sigma-K factor RskA